MARVRTGQTTAAGRRGKCVSESSRASSDRYHSVGRGIVMVWMTAIPSGGQQAVQLPEKGAIVSMPHGFQHLDGDDFVKPSFHFSVVPKKDVDTILQSGLANPLSGKIILVFGDRNAGNPASGPANGFNGKPAPSAADLKQMIVGTQSQFINDGPVLIFLGRFQVFPRMAEYGTRIGHGIIQKGLEKRIGQIVVTPDVAAAAGQCIGARQKTQFLQRLHQQPFFEIAIFH